MLTPEPSVLAVLSVSGGEITIGACACTAACTAAVTGTGAGVGASFSTTGGDTDPLLVTDSAGFGDAFGDLARAIFDAAEAKMDDDVFGDIFG